MANITNSQKSNSLVTCERTSQDTLRLTVLEAGVIEFDRRRVNSANRDIAEMHGWKQRLVDAAAIGTTDKDGNFVPPKARQKMKFAAMQRVAEHYMSGDPSWSLRGEPTERAVDMTTIWVLQAVMEVKSLPDVEAAREAIEQVAKKREWGFKKTLNAFRTAPGPVREAFERIRDANEVSSEDGEALLNDMAAGRS